MKTFRILVAATLLAAFFILALPASAECPDDDPDCRIEPPISQELGTGSETGDGLRGVAGETGSLTPIEAVIPVGAPDFVEPAPLPVGNSSTLSSSPSVFETLQLSMRYQQPSDVSCGVQALGMALDG